MLVPVIFVVALMVTLATAMLESSVFAAKIALHRSVARYSELAVSDGVADFTAELADFVKQNGSSGPWPRATSRTQPKSVCDAGIAAGGCPPFFSTVERTITDASGAVTNTSSADGVRNVQTSGINEARISVVVSATIGAQNGSIIFGSRARLLTYRVFEAAPYAIVSGSRDLTSVNDSLRTAQGDSGGAPAAWGPSAAGGSAPHDTRIHVRLVCAQTAGNDGLPWGNGGAAFEATCNPTASPADAFADKAWTHGNSGAPGWTQ
jgi:hypothetical protein